MEGGEVDELYFSLLLSVRFQRCSILLVNSDILYDLTECRGELYINVILQAYVLYCMWNKYPLYNFILLTFVG